MTAQQNENLKLPLLEASRAQGLHEDQICPVCHQSWHPFASSRLPCHSKCLLTDKGKAECLRLWGTKSTLQQIAEALGVPIGVVKLTVNESQKNLAERSGVSAYAT